MRRLWEAVQMEAAAQVAHAAPHGREAALLHRVQQEVCHEAVPGEACCGPPRGETVQMRTVRNRLHAAGGPPHTHEEEAQGRASVQLQQVPGVRHALFKHRPGSPAHHHGSSKRRR